MNKRNAAKCLTIFAGLLFGLSATGKAAGQPGRFQSHRNAVNIYMGMNSMANADASVRGYPGSIGLKGNSFSTSLKDLQLSSKFWGGFSYSRWLKQSPFSLGLSLGSDFVPTSIDETTRKTTLSLDGKKYRVELKKFKSNILQWNLGLNLLLGFPMKSFHPYVGGGPAFIVSSYSSEVKSPSGETVADVDATDKGFGYNVFAGVEYFFSSWFSIFLEGKYSQIDNLSFEPKEEDKKEGNVTYVGSGFDPRITEEYNSLKSQRLSLGLAIHF